jgi:hypothetical protein
MGCIGDCFGLVEKAKGKIETRWISNPFINTIRLSIDDGGRPRHCEH